MTHRPLPAPERTHRPPTRRERLGAMMAEWEATALPAELERLARARALIELGLGDHPTRR